MGKRTDIYPHVIGWEQERVGTDDYTEPDVWDDLRSATLSESPAQCVTFTGLYSTHQPKQGDPIEDERKESITEKLQQGTVALERVTFLILPEITKKVQVPAQRHYSYVTEWGKPGVSHVRQETIYAYEGSRTGTKKTQRRLHLGNMQNVWALKKIIAGDNNNLLEFLAEPEGKRPPIGKLVIVEPNEDEGDLDCLPKFQEQCPDVDVVIFHRPCEKWGVEVTGDVDEESFWDTQSAVENEPDLPWVIEGITHTGESTWFGALPKSGKTWVMLCSVKALLTGEPLFGDSRLRVPSPSKRVIYLVPEAGRGSVKKRLKMLGLVKYLYDPVTNPDGRLLVRTLSMGQKIPLTNPELLKLVKDADVFIDTAVRYLEGDENAVKDVKVLTENILNLLSVGARSLWIAHHAAKGFENASTMSLQNMFRGSGEFGAALTNAYGLAQTDEKTNTVHFHCITGRDLDELIPDMILQGRPHLYDKGNFKVIDANANNYSGKTKPMGKPADPVKQAKIDFAKGIDGSYQVKADAVNEKFESAHDKRTIERWLKESTFDSNQGEK